MKNLAIHAVIVLLALACFADAFRMQSKVKTMTKEDQVDEECEQCIMSCGWFIIPDYTDWLQAKTQCVQGGYQDCCSDDCNTCLPGICSALIYNYCNMYGFFD